MTARAAHVLDRNIERRPWKELGAEHQRCWTVLGWSESRWTQGDPPASEFLEWRDLSEPEQQAATTLGYTQASWDAENTWWKWGHGADSLLRLDSWARRARLG